MYLTDIPPRWRDTKSKDVTVLTKKRIFFRALAPLALRANEIILENRMRADGIISELRAGRTPSAADRAWLGEIAVTYGVSQAADAELSNAVLDELLERLDIVPVSLVLAQSAEESGWGTSRFAAEGNALFGQWTWSGKGINPEQQRAQLGNYKIAAFETPLQSVMGYMHNLNTHNAYAKLRDRRAELRHKEAELSGWDLAETLTSYSERGEEYVKSLHAIMQVNQLPATDQAYLADGPTYLLIPVGEGSGAE